MDEPRTHTSRASRRAIAVILAAAALAPGCHSFRSFKEKASAFRPFSSSFDDPQAEAKMAAGEQLFTDGNFDTARGVFKELADNTGNNAILAERARFLQAECRRLRGQYPEAVDTYHRLLMDFPTGAHRREACGRVFEIADYWLDDFREELVTRQGEKGVLHWHPHLSNPTDRSKPFLVQESRAVEALERVHTHDMTGPVADKALFWCGYVNFIRGNFDESDHFFSQLVELHKDSPLRPQAMAFAIQAKNNATGGSSYDGRKCAEALQLVHVAEATVPELTQDPAMADKLTKAKFAIRYQQAEKDYKTAEYFERTGHPGSAVFYYELTRRRYAGTWYADMATERKDVLVKQMAEGKLPPGNDPVRIVQTKWKELFGQPQNGEVKTADGQEPVGDRRPSAAPLMPAGGLPIGPGR